MAIRYEDFSKLIQNEAWKFCKKYGKAIGRDFQEFEAVGNLTFCRARERYDADMSEFSTYLTKWLRCELSQYVRREIQHRCVIDMDGVPEQIEMVGDSLRFIELKCGLTDDGIQVVDIAVHKDGRLFKKSVEEILAQNGWPRRRIKNALGEVKRMLATV